MQSSRDEVMFVFETGFSSLSMGFPFCGEIDVFLGRGSLLYRPHKCVFRGSFLVRGGVVIWHLSVCFSRFETLFFSVCMASFVSS